MDFEIKNKSRGQRSGKNIFRREYLREGVLNVIQSHRRFWKMQVSYGEELASRVNKKETR